MSKTPAHVDQMQWHQTVGYARQICARVFRDGGSPADALEAFGLKRFANETGCDWSKAVDLIAEVMCAPAQSQKAA